MHRLYAPTPAKVNLGLEIVRRRNDGYHDLVTLFQAISLFDIVEWTRTGEQFEYIGPSTVEREGDLVWRVLSSAPDFATWTGRLRLTKRIPIAAGLGGGSSDAALALRLAFPNADDAELSQRGAMFGADVPFFVHGGTALATGTGIDLTPIDTPKLWLVLVTPSIAIPEKTRSLYSGLIPADFSDGANVRDITLTFTRQLSLPERLPNSFARQLLDYPVIRYAYDRLTSAGAKVVTASGAGPTMYALTGSHQEAAAIAARLAEQSSEEWKVHVARSIGSRGGDPSVRAIAAALRG